MNVDALAALSAVVETDVTPLERLAHARDLWPRSTLALVAGRLPPSPLAVSFPQHEGHLRAAMDWAVANGVPVVPWGAGSGVCGAAAGRQDALTLDLKRMNRIGQVDAATRTVRVGPGVIGQHLEDNLARQGWATRHSPSSIWCSTVGGWAASRSAGQFSSRYGKFEDMVAAMRVVAPARAYRTGRWAQGRDLGSWVLGSEGALGVISELLVRVVPPPESRWMRGYRFASVSAAWQAMRLLMQAELHPCVVRLYDPVDTRIGGRGKGVSGASSGLLKALVGTLDARTNLSLPLALPRLLNTLAGWGGDECVLIVGWEGRTEVAAVLARHGHGLLLDAGGRDLGAEPGDHWYAHRHAVSYKLAPIFLRGAFADTMEVASTWSRLPALDAAVRAALGEDCFVMAHYSHVYREGCSIYFTFVGKGEEERYDRVWARALTAAAGAGGTVCHHHGVGPHKMYAAARELGGLAPAFAELRDELDPTGILNPGRLFPPVSVGEPPAPALDVDGCSLVATLPAQQPAAERDAWLAQRGYMLRFPAVGTLAAAVGQPRSPWESTVLGASLHLDGRRVVLLAVPRSSAGPDPRAAFPPDCYETVTVPVVPLAQPAVLVSRLAPDVRPARRTGDGWELRGPAATDLAALCERAEEAG
ncbi:MAG: FAD-binding oxidoreductase [Myxococcales bacterium]|nr:FAD-binding oxidoreductase [Myxococcales bacterium]